MKMIVRSHFRRTAFVCCVSWFTLTAGTSLAADDVVTVHDYLARLGLADVQVLHLEKSLDRSASGESRDALARKLADLYAERLISAADDKPRYDDLTQRVGDLLRRHPAASTPALQVTLLQADYHRAEALLLKWLDDGGDDVLVDARKLLQRIAPALNDRQQELNARVAALVEKVDKTEPEDARATLEQELRRQQVVAGRATYFAGWAEYYWGIALQGEAAKTAVANESFAAARMAFRQLLDINDGDKYSDLDAGSLGLESLWRARAAIGLGLAETALGDLAAAEKVFGALNDASVAPSVREQVAYWRLVGLLHANLLTEATKFAEQQLDQLGDRATTGKVSLCAALVRFAYARRGEGGDARRRLGQLGIRGLARLKQFVLLRQLMAKYAIGNDGGGSLYVGWIQGQQLFAQAEAKQDGALYSQAIETLTAALATPDAKSDAVVTAQCRQLLAWCRYRRSEFDAAAQQFRQAMFALKGVDPKAAAEAAWMAFVCLQQLAAKDPKQTPAAIEALETLKQEFPDSPQAKKADYHLAKLQRPTTSPEESIRALQKITAKEPNYLNARYELCQLYHQRWARAAAHSTAAQTAAAEVLAAVDQFIRDASAEADAQRRLKAALLAADVLLSGTPADPGRASAYLNQLQKTAESLPASSPAVAEYHYRRLQHAQQTGDTRSVERHAVWLAKNAAGSTYELAAVTILARKADVDVKGGTTDQKSARQTEAARIYARLVELLGDSPETIAAKKNALIASSKLAQYQFELGQFASAAAQLDQILAAFPNDRGYLRRAGLAQYQAGHHAAALDHWRTLLAGVEKSSDDWFEAKYFQLECLRVTDPAAARVTLDQFELLYPTLGPPAWREKFQTLRRAL